MSDNFTADVASVQKPYDFGKATFFPFLNFKFSLKLAIVYAVIAAVVFAILLVWLGSDLVQLFAAMEDLETQSDPSAFLGFMLGFYGKLFLGLLLFWPVYASYVTAVHRKAVMNIDGGTIPMKFGGTELKVMLTQLVLGFIYTGILLAFYFAVIVLVLIVAALASANDTLGVIFGIIAFFAGVAALIFALFVAVRFAAAVPLTVYNDKFTIGESWTATKKRGWWMILSYLVIGLIGLVAGYIIQLLLMVVVLAGLPFEELEQIDSLPEDEVGGALMSIFTSPTIIIPLLIVLIIYMVFDTFIKMCNPGVGAYVTKEYKGGHDLESISALYD